jgi:hypothetical protein
VCVVQRVGDVVEVEVLRGVGRDPHTSNMRLQLVERREVTSGSRSMGDPTAVWRSTEVRPAHFLGIAPSPEKPNGKQTDATSPLE